MALWGAELEVRGSGRDGDVAHFHSDEGFLCLTQALLVDTAVAGRSNVNDDNDEEEKKKKRRKEEHVTSTATAAASAAATPRVVLCARTRRGNDAVLFVLNEKQPQARCKILFRKDAKFYLRSDAAAEEGDASAAAAAEKQAGAADGKEEKPRWRVQLLGDMAPHPCGDACGWSCCCGDGDDQWSKEKEQLAADVLRELKRRRREDQRPRQLRRHVSNNDHDAEEAPMLVRVDGQQQQQQQQQQQRHGEHKTKTATGMPSETAAGLASLLLSVRQLNTIPSLAEQLDGNKQTPAAEHHVQSCTGGTGEQKQQQQQQQQKSKQRPVKTEKAPPAKRLKTEIQQQQQQQQQRGDATQQQHMQQQLKKKGQQQQQQQQQKTEQQKGENQRQNAAGHHGEPASERPQQQQPELREGQRFVLKCGVTCEILSLPTKKKQQMLPTAGSSGATTAAVSGGVRTGERVTVQYKGVLAAGLRKFDSGKIGFTVGKKEVISGLEAGVIGMSVGEKRRLLIPSALGYGNRGAPPAIPPRADLIFDVTLLARANTRK